jgi:hypothetical protein
MVHRVFISFACFGILAAAGGSVLVACDNGGTGGSSGGTTASGKGGSATTASGSPTTSSGGTTNAIMCANNYCSIGMGGYPYSYADGDGPMKTATGMSHATLAMDMLCISGTVMQLPANPTQTDYSNDWGCGIGINLNQSMGMGDAGGGTPMGATLTGNGITVSTNGVPMCTSARVVIDHGGKDYCAALTDGKEIPWATFNQTCWTTGGTALTGAPTDSTHLEVQFVTTKANDCPFMNFCLTNVSL